MNRKVRIGILGIGGVGGFVGAPLARFYGNVDDVEVIFICRGVPLETIKSKGLHLQSQEGEIIVKPTLCSNNSTEIGILDALIITTKSYSLKDVVKEYKGVIGEHTVLLTLQNMINSKEIIREVIPDKGIVLEGCIYVASKVDKPGKIQHVGGPGKIVIGGEKENEYRWLIDLLTNGGLDVTYEENIKDKLWKKFLFVAPVAALTTAYNISFGQLLENERLMSILENMMIEIQSLATKNDINLSNKDILNAKELLTKFPYESKSSLQLDYENKNQTEKYYLVDYVIEHCNKNGLEASYYQMVNDKITA